MPSQENLNTPIQLIFREGDRTEIIDLGSRYIALAKEIRGLREAHQKKVVEHKEAVTKLRLDYDAKYQSLWDRHQRLRKKHEDLITHVDHCPHVRIIRPAPIASRSFVADIPEDIIGRDNDRSDKPCRCKDFSELKAPINPECGSENPICHVNPELQKKVYLKARKIVIACAMPKPTEDYDNSDEENTMLESEHANKAELGQTELANHGFQTNHKVNTVQQTTNTTGTSWVCRTSPQIARTQRTLLTEIWESQTACGIAHNVTLSAVGVIEYKAIGNRYM
ncbi:hypothetical protein DFH09DRAFT_1401918 [Mycena vulgaris]|nr:hypothetical protein DFH09DRAFT_1401918 [Mycena vulgaris]